MFSSSNVNESMLPGSDLVLDSVIPCVDPSSESLDANSKVFGSFSDFDIIGFVSRHCMSLFLGRMIYFHRCILCIHFREDFFLHTTHALKVMNPFMFSYSCPVATFSSTCVSESSSLIWFIERGDQAITLPLYIVKTCLNGLPG